MVALEEGIHMTNLNVLLVEDSSIKVRMTGLCILLATRVRAQLVKTETSVPPEEGEASLPPKEQKLRARTMLSRNDHLLEEGASLPLQRIFPRLEEGASPTHQRIFPLQEEGASPTRRTPKVQPGYRKFLLLCWTDPLTSSGDNDMIAPGEAQEELTPL